MLLPTSNTRPTANNFETETHKLSNIHKLGLLGSGIKASIIIGFNFALLGALDYLLALLAGINIVFSSLDPFDLAGAFFIGGAIWTVPALASIIHITKDDSSPSPMSLFLICAVTKILAAATGAILLGLAMKPVAICVAMTLVPSLMVTLCAELVNYLSGSKKTNETLSTDEVKPIESRTPGFHSFWASNTETINPPTSINTLSAGYGA